MCNQVKCAKVTPSGHGTVNEAAVTVLYNAYVLYVRYA